MCNGLAASTATAVSQINFLLGSVHQMSLGEVAELLQDWRESWQSRARLLRLLGAHGMEERDSGGDGNCQFTSISDQLWKTPQEHERVRGDVVKQLRSNPGWYGNFIDTDSGESFDEYTDRMSIVGQWGDHVTLQALADAYGVRIVLLTSFEREPVIELVPCEAKFAQTLLLSFWAEIHYSSIRPRGKEVVQAPAGGCAMSQCAIS